MESQAIIPSSPTPFPMIHFLSRFSFSLLFVGSGGVSPHLEPFGNAPLRTNSQPPASHMEGNPWPREFYEIVKDKQHITLAPIEFHETFTIMFAMNNYSYREWVRYFDCLTSTKTENGDPSFTDWIEIVGRAPRDKTGLMFVIQRDGYDVEECIVYNEAVDLHRWQHITASIDHAGIMRLYVDGELRSSHQAKFTPKRGIRDQNRMAAKAIDRKQNTTSITFVFLIIFDSIHFCSFVFFLFPLSSC